MSNNSKKQKLDEKQMLLPFHTKPLGNDTGKVISLKGYRSNHEQVFEKQRRKKIINKLLSHAKSLGW